MGRILRMRSGIKTFLFLMTVGMSALLVTRVTAQEGTRQTTILVQYIEYEWWLIRWSDNQIVCQIFIDHEGLPTAEEVFQNCGEEIAVEWSTTGGCKAENPSSCPGYYLHFASYEQKEKEVVIDLPPSTVWITLEGCSPIPPENLCTQMPSLLFIGEEPLPNETITAIHGTYNGYPFTCEGDRCSIPLAVTPVDGILVEFWADSSFGDSSQIFEAKVRVIESGVSSTQGASGWYVDVLSSQWIGNEVASCAETWQAFPPIGTPPPWLSTPDQSQLLASNEAYYYLAGRLISQGVVNASSCATGGLLPNGYADSCGLEIAKTEVQAWQNLFDNRIIQVSKNTGVPGQLLKNLFAQESQFWPGIFRVPYEFGLGQITDNGTDAILLWNPTFYKQFCPLVLSQDTCDEGYIHLEDEEQALLRGALAIQANADCPSCPTGVDLTNESVPLFANTLLANCEQIGQIVYTATGEIGGDVSTYEDLWRFTVANYHAGPGCVSFAIHSAWNNNSPILTWEDVSTRFTVPCQGVVPYVNKITQ